MSCSCCSCCCSCCCWTRKKESLLPEEEPAGGGGGGGEDEQSWRNMDVSLLREQYRSSREKQKKRPQVLLFRKVSEELSEAVSIVPVTQGLTPSPLTITFDPDPTTYDPWQIHLDLHRHSRSIVTIQLPVSPPETNSSIDSCSRHSSCSSSEADTSQHESRYRKLSVDSLHSFREMSPCSSFNSKQENLFNADTSRGDPDPERSTGGSFCDSVVDPVQDIASLSVSKQRSREGPPDGSTGSSKEDSVGSSFTDSQESSAHSIGNSSEESSTPIASITDSPSSSTTNLHQDPTKTQSKDTKTTNGDLEASARRGHRRWSASAKKFTRQLGVVGEGSSTVVQQNQNYYPFPSRKPPRISEAARRLGMYSSF
ncbi:hypothetical protein Q5P01_004387 [Channa striata]|uniref:Uncharacterized protein n=1 Tax=Channa striata TaxID=64152 RepID=A0AA88NL92_CHASR|nr:hypothetical protein Q5P01_004387 [Channa striata]